MTCSICNSIEIVEQPYAGLHAYTTIFVCGCKIIQSINENFFIYDTITKFK